MKSVGVSRLSLIVGIAGGIYAASLVAPVTANNGPAVKYALLNIGQLAAAGVVGFMACWGSVRIIAWIVRGFMHDADSN